MDGHVGRPEARFALGAVGLAEQHRTVLPAPELPGDLERDRDRQQRVADPEPLQQPQRVGRDLDAGADLGELGLLLEDPHVQNTGP